MSYRAVEFEDVHC